MNTMFHLPEGEPAYGQRVLGNAANLLDDGSIDGEVAVVDNGDGVRHLLAEASTAAGVRSLVDDGVEVCACRHTLRNAAYSDDDLVDGVRVVASAMSELTLKQDAGYAYVRP